MVEFEKRLHAPWKPHTGDRDSTVSPAGLRPLSATASNS